MSSKAKPDKNGKPEKIADELLAQVKFTNQELQNAELNVIAKRGAMTTLNQYITKAYNLVEGDQVTPEGEILRQSQVEHG